MKQVLPALAFGSGSPGRSYWARVQTLTRIGLLLLFTPTLLSGRALAETEPPIIIESYVGERPSDADFYLGILAGRQDRYSTRRGEALKQEIEARVSSGPGGTENIQTLRSQVIEGRRLFIEGEFDQAIAHLEATLAIMQRLVAQVATDQGLRASQHEALLYLAQAFLRKKALPKARERIAEVIRSFPDRDLSPSQYSPDLVDFFHSVRRDMARQPRSVLEVTSTPPGCMVFINEHFAGMSPVKVPDLLPGTYRVYLQRQDVQGRIHPVVMKGQPMRLNVDFSLDRVLKSTTFAGFLFPDEEARKQGETLAAAALGNLLNAKEVLLLGIRRHQGFRTLYGLIVKPGSKRITRQALLRLEPTAPSAKGVYALLDELLGHSSAGEPPKGSPADPTHAPPPPMRVETPRGRNPAFQPLKWTALALGVAGLAAGIPLIVLDGRRTCDLPEGVLCPENYQTLVPGAVLAGAGGAALVASGVFFFLDSRGESNSTRQATLSPWVSGGGGGLTAVGTW